MGLLLGFVCFKPSPLGRHPKWWMKAAWAERLTMADLILGLIGLCPRVPSKQMLFRNFQGERGFANAGESCECEYWCSHCACVKVHIQVLVNLRVCWKRKVIWCSNEERVGKAYPFLKWLLVLVCTLLVSQSWYSSLKLIFSNIC
jgi:hypothetical protein